MNYKISHLSAHRLPVGTQTAFCDVVLPATPVLKLAAIFVMLGWLSSFTAQAAIQQVNVLPGRPNSGSYVIANAVSPAYASFPTALAIDVDSGGNTVKKALLAWYTGGDPTPPGQVIVAKSTNGGLTFGAGAVSPIGFLNAIKKRNGTILSIPFSASSGNYYTSTDNLNTPFVTNSGLTVSPGMLFDMGILEENNGTLYAVGYTAGNSKITKSTNGGVTWSGAGLANIGTVNVPVAGYNYSETTIERCANGSWLAVMRIDPDQNMRYARSTNQGVSWTTPALLPGITSNGKAPVLKLLPNGILVLGWGEGAGAAGRHCKLAFSADGNGTSWTNVTTLLTGVSNVSESTGYCAIWPMGPNRLMYISDTGTSWSYSSYAASKFKVWGKMVDVVPTHVNRIDLKGRVAAGTVTITTDLTYSNATHPEARSSGAYDGSTDYWSGAFRSATSGSYTIDLQQTYSLTAVGVALHYNNAQSATVERSTDGSTWTTIKTYTNATHHAIDYTSFTTAPQSARYVRITVNGAGPLICLNEVELYSTTDSFENCAIADSATVHGIIPPGLGYVPAGTSASLYGFAVRENVGYQSDRAFEMYDGSSTWQAGIRKTTTAATTKTLEFRIKPTAYHLTEVNSAILFLIKGAVTNPVGDTAFYLRVQKGGSVDYLVGTTWTQLAGDNTVQENVWSTIKVVASASTDTAQVSVNGVSIGTASKYSGAAANVTSLNGFVFASPGMTFWGEKALFDDILFE